MEEKKKVGVKFYKENAIEKKSPKKKKKKWMCEVIRTFPGKSKGKSEWQIRGASAGPKKLHFKKKKTV